MDGEDPHLPLLLLFLFFLFPLLMQLSKLSPSGHYLSLPLTCICHSFLVSRRAFADVTLEPPVNPAEGDVIVVLPIIRCFSTVVKTRCRVANDSKSICLCLSGFVSLGSALRDPPVSVSHSFLAPTSVQPTLFTSFPPLVLSKCEEKERRRKRKEGKGRRGPKPGKSEHLSQRWTLGACCCVVSCSKHGRPLRKLSIVDA